MPEYDFRCEFCESIFTEMHKIDDAPDNIKCYFCGGNAPRIISFKGGLQTDHPKWIDNNLRNSIQTENEPPIESRKDLRRVVKQKDLIETA